LEEFRLIYRHSIFTDKVPRQKCLLKNRHLNNEGQECKIGHVEEKTLVGGRG
jgi:hypothetical protein